MASATSEETSARVRRDTVHLAHPRFPGTEGAAATRAYLCARIREMGWTAIEDAFVRTIGDEEVAFCNVLGVPPGPSVPPHAVLIAHSDSLPGYTGAVDAATGMAAVLEMARLCGPRVSLVALVDGEEAYPPHAWSPSTSMSGSQRLVAWLAARRAVRVGPVLVLDLWGGPSSTTFDIPRWASADAVHFHRRLARADEICRADAEARGEDRDRLLFPSPGPAPPLFRRTVRATETQDDSWPFLGRYPCVVDLLGTPFPPQWHRPDDVPDNVAWHNVLRGIRVVSSVLLLD